MIIFYQLTWLNFMRRQFFYWISVVLLFPNEHQTNAEMFCEFSEPVKLQKYFLCALYYIYTVCCVRRKCQCLPCLTHRELIRSILIENQYSQMIERNKYLIDFQTNQVLSSFVCTPVFDENSNCNLLCSWCVIFSIQVDNVITNVSVLVFNCCGSQSEANWSLSRPENLKPTPM